MHAFVFSPRLSPNIEEEKTKENSFNTIIAAGLLGHVNQNCTIAE